MKLNYETLRDKILGCWQGKNAGGTLGAPFEGKRGLSDIKWYQQKDIENNPPANDDLDLQIAWLNAVEEYGPTVSAPVLGEYWLTYITPNWSEYGIGKSNMRRGFAPPLSGRVSNYYKDSCGCFIRSEIWACLAPGLPEIATRYACLDGCVDHADDGLYGEIFFAAVQSAAFVESDADKLIDIGLSYIPADCAVAEAVNLVRKAYKDGKTWKEARKELFAKVPGAFSACWMKLKDQDPDEMAHTHVGFDAPNNIGITVIGWLWGEGDLGKSICIAADCGEDADCSAATVGAIVGIINGEKKLPEKWIKPFGGIIKTVCLEPNSELRIPKTVTEFTDRILACIPKILPVKNINFDSGNGSFEVITADTMFADRDEYLVNGRRDCEIRPFKTEEIVDMKGYTQFFVFDFFKAAVELEREPFIGTGETFSLKIKLYDSGMIRSQQWVNGDVYVSAGLTVESGAHFSLPLHNSYKFKSEHTVILRADNLVNPVNNVLIDLEINGRHSYGTAKIKLISK